ncbi:hypothetical protein [Bradyrhizobium japonicum]|nr:hypothetical protein [Bradyrhizobium japonicum]
MTEFALSERESITREVLLHSLSELISLREKVEQAELAASFYGQRTMRRTLLRAVPPAAQRRGAAGV